MPSLRLALGLGLGLRLKQELKLGQELRLNLKLGPGQGLRLGSWSPPRKRRRRALGGGTPRRRRGAPWPAVALARLEWEERGGGVEVVGVFRGWWAAGSGQVGRSERQGAARHGRKGDVGWAAFMERPRLTRAWFPVSHFFYFSVYTRVVAPSPRNSQNPRDGSRSRGYAARRCRARAGGEGCCAHQRSAVPLLEAAQGHFFCPLSPTRKIASFLHHHFLGLQN